jgi:hypothetical protein
MKGEKYMAKVCLDCFEIYKEESLQSDKVNNFQYCPKHSCIGEVVEIDELMLPVIIELNKKNYYTKYCCAGHYYDRSPNSYIFFEDCVKLPSLPEGYEYDKDNSNTIRNYFSQYINNDQEIYNEDNYFEIINENANTLLRWAKSLPNAIEEGE